MSSPAIAPLLTPAELQKFEGPLIAMAQQANGSLPKLLTAFFSFLHRRTDFYCILPQDNGSAAAAGGGRSNVGFKEGQAEQILLATFRQFPLRRVGPPLPTATTRSSSKSPSSSQEVVGNGTSKATNEGTVSPAKAKKDEIESNKAKKKVVAAASAADVITKDNPTETKDKEKATKPTTTTTTTNNNNTKETTIRYTNDGKQIPIGNGGSTSRYVWTQTLEEVTVHIPIPNGTRAKDLHVKIDAHSLCVKRKDGDCAALSPLEGMFFARIRPDECTWTIESSSSAAAAESMTTLQLTLDKIQRTWWDIVISGDNPLIDTTMVDSSRHIDTYDDKTQAQIRRIIHDQRQERLGLSSDSLQVQGGSSGGGGKIPSMPSGVEYIDGETLDKATIGK
eukprot:CAMPEP_0201728836 /NCGR_PEP_ID=MMETSP0593-20130828/17243_1 /ASSEMBLY_ACC=CAM_ASM_000672 /TAXON_ID=267983 /ORGANISM="Skeletonema japonicum, Strain CCMP2506" /LENGTH=392 /DNA_ID=CAMNT_0048221059 /DNA_START=38 /DNA_END=1216 /DNA_ORIENTATION=-